MPKTKQQIKNQSGNAILAIFTAVAVIGTIGGSTAILLQGPLKTMGEVNQTTMTEGYLFSAGKMVLLDAENWTADGDCDGDRIVEPRPWRTAGALPAPTGGGLIPNEIGSMKRDPWGTQLGYCGWDHGSLINGVTSSGDECTDTNRLQGTNRRDYPAVVVISAGPNETFDSTCNNYVDTTPADGEADTPLFVPGGDDMYVVYSYAEAAQELPNIWREDSPNIWSLNIEGGAPELVSNDDVEFSGSDVFSPARIEMVGQLGLLLPDETELPSCDGTTENQMRRNMGGVDPVLEICESGTFEPISGGSGSDYSSLIDSVNIVGTKEGLVGYWRFDETTGTEAVDSIGGNNATMINGMTADTASTIGQIGGSLNFLRTGLEQMNVANIYNMNAFTACFWFNIKITAGGGSTLFSISSNGARHWSLSHNDVLEEVFIADDIASPTGTSNMVITPSPAKFNKWNHVCAGVNESQNTLLYVNGRLIDNSTPAEGFFSNLDSDIKFGANNAGFRAIDGMMDDVRLYNRGLSLSEVQDIYNKDNYVAQTTIRENVTARHTVDSYGLSLLLNDDTIGAMAGIAFKLDPDLNPIQPPSAAIVASRILAPSNANLLFRTYSPNDNLQTRMVLDRLGNLTIGDTAEGEAKLNIGDWTAGWNNDYSNGLLASNDGYANPTLTFFGDKQSDDSSTQLLFSNILRLQHSDDTATTLNEYMRFSSVSPEITHYGDINVDQNNEVSVLRIGTYSNTATDTNEFRFQRRDGNSTSMAKNFRVGRILFRGFDGDDYTTGGNGYIRSHIEDSSNNNSLPRPDLIFETRQNGTTSSDELRIRPRNKQVGFKVDNPQAAFHVNGRIEITEGPIIGDDEICLSSRDEGTLRYRSGAYEVCDGTDWVAVGGDATQDICKGLPFDFYDRDSLTANTDYETNSILIGGIKGECPFTVASNTSSITIYKNGTSVSGSFTTVRSGDRIHLEYTSASNPAEYVTVYVKVGNYEDTANFQTAGKIVFVTSVGSKGNAGGYAGIKALCSNLAANAGIKGNFLPWLSIEADPEPRPINAFRRYESEYILVNGTNVANDWTDLTDGNINNQINLTELNTSYLGDVGTAANTAGDRATGGTTSACGNWTSNTESGWRGDTLDGSNWTVGGGNRGCNGSMRFYCFEQ